MMSYGETTLCRMQFIREYFGEPPADRCGHCDNCKRPREQAVRRRPQVPRKPPAAAKPAFTQSQIVTHPRFGTGKILEARGDELTIEFVRHGTRRVLASYVAPASAAQV
jgi:ATP-dependent DNA helicase RecQ